MTDLEWAATEAPPSRATWTCSRVGCGRRCVQPNRLPLYTHGHPGDWCAACVGMSARDVIRVARGYIRRTLDARSLDV